MVAGPAERRRNFVANKMENFLRILQLEDELKQAIFELATVEEERNVLAGELCRTAEFGEWLMGQDSSSMLTYRSRVEGSKVEDEDDLTLALRFAGRARLSAHKEGA
jgi:hypothetical protein